MYTFVDKGALSVTIIPTVGRLSNAIQQTGGRVGGSNNSTSSVEPIDCDANPSL